MIEATILASERVRLPDGREFTGLNCETDAARALIADGMAWSEVILFRWADGRASSNGRLSAYGRIRHTEDGPQRWRPHPKAQMAPPLADWAAFLASEAAERREAAQNARNAQKAAAAGAGVGAA